MYAAKLYYYKILIIHFTMQQRVFLQKLSFIYIFKFLLVLDDLVLLAISHEKSYLGKFSSNIMCWIFRQLD